MATIQDLTDKVKALEDAQAAQAQRDIDLIAKLNETIASLQGLQGKTTLTAEDQAALDAAVNGVQTVTDALGAEDQPTAPAPVAPPPTPTPAP